MAYSDIIPQGGRQASGQGTQANPMIITNRSQINNLPSGTYFTYQGKTYKSK